LSKSLQDQLLALGLAKTSAREAPRKQQSKPSAAARSGAAKPADSERRPFKPRPAQQTGSAKPGSIKSGSVKSGSAKSAPDLKQDENISLEQAYRIREAQEKSAKQKAHEIKMEEDRRRAALNRQIKQIVDAGRLNLPDAAEGRYFLYKNRIRKVWVSPEQLLELNSGKLGVVYLAGGYHILASEQIEQVRQLSPDHVPDLLAGAEDDDFDAAGMSEADSNTHAPDAERQTSGSEV